VVIDPIRDEAGHLIGFAKITRDITERKVAQEALRESEEQFRLLVQGVTDYAIFMLSPDGEVTSWNAGAERIKGYSRDEILGKHFSCFYTEDDRASGAPALTLSTAAAEGRSEREGWRVRKDGSRFWAHVVVDAIRDEAGELVGFAKVTRDVTERKQAAEALERANAALFQSQKMESLGQLTGGVAHDFNNLLAVMSNGLDVLSLRVLDHADLRMLETMQRAVARGATLTQQLLSFARQQPLKVEKCNLNAVIRGFEAVLRRAVDGMIELEVRPEPGPRPVLLDVARFESALLNLVVNARDAMPQGGSITVTTGIRLGAELQSRHHAAEPARRYACLDVSDTGTGMTPEVRARIFEPFFTTKQANQGTGLGLAVVYGITSSHEGFIDVDSTLGVGSTFHVYLPLAVDVTLAAPTAGNAEFPSGTESLLVVDDETPLRTLLAAAFTRKGYRVSTAATGLEAIEIIGDSTRALDAVLLDLNMPGTNGVQVLKVIRACRPNLPVLVISGHITPEVRVEFQQLNQRELIEKPYRLDDVGRRLRTMFDKPASLRK
jgi:PAS domain S-box-containing protein